VTWAVLLGLSAGACGRGRGVPVETQPLPGPLAAAGAVATSRVETFRIAMPELGGRQRTIRVYLPAGYGSGALSFPVLYLQDGQQLFSPGPFGDWLVDETMDSLVGRARSGGMIVVGIDNGEQHRWDEYGPWVNRSMHEWFDPRYAPAAAGGQGAAYLAFLAGTLKPEIDRRYRTLADREHTGIGGSSMGGLIALYAGLSRPDVFTKVMAMSPAVWFAEGGGPWLSGNRLLADLRARRPLPRDVRFYVDVGTNERSRDVDPDVVDGRGAPVSYPRAYLEGSQAVVDALRAGGVPDSNLRFVVDTGAVHHERAWARRLPGAVTWLYQ
jgi:predicted alpha/beta superfamily hydrolase